VFDDYVTFPLAGSELPAANHEKENSHDESQ
jgi:hypothetical protein